MDPSVRENHELPALEAEKHRSKVVGRDRLAGFTAYGLLASPGSPSLGWSLGAGLLE
jgi:hypothetical protein